MAYIYILMFQIVFPMYVKGHMVRTDQIEFCFHGDTDNIQTLLFFGSRGDSLSGAEDEGPVSH